MIIFLYCLTALFLSHSLVEPQSTGKLHSLGPWPRNMRGISRPNNGCLCVLHLLLQTDTHLYPFLPFYLHLSFFCSGFSRLMLLLFNSLTLSVAKHRGIKPHLQVSWQKCRFLFRFPAAPEDTHEESVRHKSCWSSLFLKKKCCSWTQTELPSADLVGRFRLDLWEEVACSALSRSNDNKPFSWDTLFIKYGNAAHVWQTRGGQNNGMIQRLTLHLTKSHFNGKT